MATEHKNKKMRVKICLAMAVCLLVILDWGWNNHSQAKPPAGNDSEATAAGAHHSLALNVVNRLLSMANKKPC